MQRRWYVVVVAVALACAGTVTSMAQTAPPAPRAPREGEVAAAPIRCWWKTDRTAIRVGERFQLVLTCGVIETT